jgi:hypothetical protein
MRGLCAPRCAAVGPRRALPACDPLGRAPGGRKAYVKLSIYISFFVFHFAFRLHLPNSIDSSKCTCNKNNITKNTHTPTAPPAPASSGPAGEQGRALFDLLYRDVEDWEFITDELVRRDVTDTAMGEEFFLFEEVIEDVLLVFSRDPSVHRRITAARRAPHDPVLAGLPRGTEAACQSQTPPPGLRVFFFFFFFSFFFFSFFLLLFYTQTHTHTYTQLIP